MDGLIKDYARITQLMKSLSEEVDTFVSNTGKLINGADAPVALAALFEAHVTHFEEEEGDKINDDDGEKENNKNDGSKVDDSP